jgi:hypothetical protein
VSSLPTASSTTPLTERRLIQHTPAVVMVTITVGAEAGATIIGGGIAGIADGTLIDSQPPMMAPRCRLRVC